MTREEAYRNLTEYDIFELLMREIYLKSGFDDRQSIERFLLTAVQQNNIPARNSSSQIYGEMIQMREAAFYTENSKLNNQRDHKFQHFDNTGYKLSESNKISIVKHSRYGVSGFHDHEFFEIAYLFTGTCNHEFLINGEKVKTHLNAGDLVIIPPGLMHSINIYDESLMVNVLIHTQTFHSAFLSQLPKNNQLYRFFSSALFSDEKQSYIIIPNNSEKLPELVLDLYIEQQQNDVYSSKISENLLQIFFLEILRSKHGTMELSTQISESDKLLAELLLYVENHYQHTGLDDVARQFHFSKTYINRIFKSAMHTTILQYIKQLRLAEAQKLLADKSLAIRDIAEMVGYNDISYFIEEYKKAYGVTPKAARHTEKTD